MEKSGKGKTRRKIMWFMFFVCIIVVLQVKDFALLMHDVWQHDCVQLGKGCHSYCSLVHLTDDHL